MNWIWFFLIFSFVLALIGTPSDKAELRTVKKRIETKWKVDETKLLAALTKPSTVFKMLSPFLLIGMALLFRDVLLERMMVETGEMMQHLYLGMHKMDTALLWAAILTLPIIWFFVTKQSIEESCVPVRVKNW